MIALFVLMGVWGGARRRFATLQFIIYSLGRLAADAGRDRRALGVEGGSFDLGVAGRPGDATRVWMFGAFALAFCIKAPMFPLHGWLPAAYRESSPEVTALLSGRRVEGRRLRPDPASRCRCSRPRPTTGAGCSWASRLAGLLYASLRRVPPARRARRDRLLEPRPDEPDHSTRAICRRLQRQRTHRRHLPDGQPRRRLAGGVPADRPGRAAHRHRRAYAHWAGSPTGGRSPRPCSCSPRCSRWPCPARACSSRSSTS